MIAVFFPLARILVVCEIQCYTHIDDGVSRGGVVTLWGWPGHPGNHGWLPLCPDFDSFQAIYNPEVTAKRVHEQEAFLTLFKWKSQGTVVQVSRDFLSWLRL